jgi:acyl carrier protein
MSDDLRDRIRSFIQNELLLVPGHPLDDTTPLVSGGLVDSLGIAQLGVFLEKSFDVEIPDGELTLDNVDTIDDIARLVARRGGTVR